MELIKVFYLTQTSITHNLSISYSKYFIAKIIFENIYSKIMLFYENQIKRLYERKKILCIHNKDNIC